MAAIFLFFLLAASCCGHIQIVGHRGSSGEAPENTLPAFELAIEQRVNAIETDLQLTKDGVIVLMHDSTLDRTTNGTGLVAETTLAEIKSLDAGSWKSPRFAGIRVPTLDECVAVVQKTCATCDIVLDLKLLTEKMVDILERRVEQYALGSRAILGSWDHKQAELCKKRIPTATLMYITSVVPSPESLEDWRSIGLNSFSIDHNALSFHPEFVQVAQNASIRMYVWTVDESEVIERVRRWHVDAVITDYPLRVFGAETSSEGAAEESQLRWATRACKESQFGWASPGIMRDRLLSLEECAESHSKRCHEKKNDHECKLLSYKILQLIKSFYN